VRQILVEAAQSKRPEDRPDHVRMQIARLAPALKGLVASATSGETEDVPVLLRALAQLDRYARENFLVASPSAEMLGEGTEEHSAAVAQSQERLRERRALERSDAPGPHKLDRSLFNGADFSAAGLGLASETLGKETWPEGEDENGAWGEEERAVEA
jgi:hypothetical protein